MYTPINQNKKLILEAKKKQKTNQEQRTQIYSLRLSPESLQCSPFPSSIFLSKLGAGVKYLVGKMTRGECKRCRHPPPLWSMSSKNTSWWPELVCKSRQPFFEQCNTQKRNSRRTHLVWRWSRRLWPKVDIRREGERLSLEGNLAKFTEILNYERISTMEQVLWFLLFFFLQISWYC